MMTTLSRTIPAKRGKQSSLKRRLNPAKPKQAGLSRPPDSTLVQRAVAEPADLTAAEVKQLQRMVGNRTVTHLIQTSSVIQRSFDAGKFLASLETQTEEQREAAILKKLKDWKKWSLKSTRRQNVANLIKGLHNLGYSSLINFIETVHPDIFGGELVPDFENLTDEPEKVEKIESSDYRQVLQDQLDSLKIGLAQWEERKKDDSWQEYGDYDFEGEASNVEALVGGLGEPGTLSGKLGVGGNLQGSYQKGGVGISGGIGGFIGGEGKVKGEAKKSKTGVSGSVEGEYFAGARQEGQLSFTMDNKFGNIIAGLEEQAKVGSWGTGSGNIALGLTGLSAEAKAYLAVGGQVTLKGNFDAKTKRGGVGLVMDGEGTAFAGAEAEGAAEFSASLTKGIAAAVTAKAFAGVKATANGQVMFQLTGRPIFGLKGTAEVSYGAGGEFEATLKVPLFGNSEFGFKTGAALGLGSSAGGSVVVNMGNIALSAKEILLGLRNLPAKMQGYESLSMKDEEILQKLNLLLTVYQRAIKAAENKIKKYDKVPEEKRSLLV